MTVASTRTPRNGLSHVVGEIDRPLSTLTIPRFLDDTADRYPDREAAVFPQAAVRWAWRALRDEADRLAGALLRLGLVRGDRLGIWSPNRPEWVLAQYATARIGVVLVNLNPAYRQAEL